MVSNKMHLMAYLEGIFHCTICTDEQYNDQDFPCFHTEPLPLVSSYDALNLLDLFCLCTSLVLEFIIYDKISAITRMSSMYTTSLIPSSLSRDITAIHWLHGFGKDPGSTEQSWTENQRYCLSDWWIGIVK